jgi:SAM-dependent methyltransferase
MMMHLREKSASLAHPPRIVRGDITKLPFRDHAFNAALAVHVFHLIEDERASLLEVKRVLQPGGRLLFGGEQRQLKQIEELLFTECDNAVQDELTGILKEYGVKRRDQDEVDRRISEIARTLGAEVHELPPVEWNYEISGAEIVTRIESRVTSSLWNIPEETLNVLVLRLKSRLEERIGPLSTMLKFRRIFRLVCVHFPE